MPDRLPDLAELIADPSRANEIPERTLPRVLQEITDRQSRLTTLGIVVAARLAGCVAKPGGSGEGRPMLKADEVARILRVPTASVYALVPG
jgi:hypothetical protein